MSVRTERHPLGSEVTSGDGLWKRSPYIATIQALETYDNEGLPVWGPRIGLYNSATSEFLRLTPEYWQIFDGCSASGRFRIKDLAQSLNLSIEQAHSAVMELYEKRVILSCNENLLQPLSLDFNKAALYLELTQHCNLGCAGCTVGVDQYPHGTAKTMDVPRLTQILTQTVSSAKELGLQGLNIKWAGGEPLLPQSFRLIEQAQSVLADLRRQYPGIELTQVVLTNGTRLSEDVVSYLKSKDIHVVVSLWGIGSQNDTLRVVRNPRDRYDHIVDGIRRLQDYEVPFNLNHVISPENAKDFGTFMRCIWDTESAGFIGDPQKGPLRINISFFRPQTQSLLHQLAQRGGYDQIVQGTRGGFAVILELLNRGMSVPPLDEWDYLSLSRLAPTTCGTGRNYIAAGPDGFAPCHELLFNRSRPVPEGENLFFEMFRQHYPKPDQLKGIYLETSGIGQSDRILLALHGGMGCPNTAQAENDGQLGIASSAAKHLYLPLFPELLALEYMRRTQSTTDHHES